MASDSMDVDSHGGKKRKAEDLPEEAQPPRRIRVSRLLARLRCRGHRTGG